MRKPRTKRTNTKANWRAELQAMNERLPKQLALRDKILAQTEAFLARKRELEALAFEQICLSERLSPFDLLRARHAEPREPTEEVSIEDDDHDESETA